MVASMAKDALRAMSDAVLAITAERAVDPVLQRLIDSARDLEAAYVALGIENARLLERSRELFTIEERKRLARELHDSVTQTLLGIGLTAEAALALLTPDPARARAELEHLREMTSGALQELRSLIFELRPADLETEGLGAALHKYVALLRRLHGRQIELELRGERRLPADVEQALLRIAQEALSNAVRHAEATRIDLMLDVRQPLVRLRVSDDGQGFDPAEARTRSRRLGLTSMTERAEALGGELTINSNPGRGTTVVVETKVGETG
jgi:signal transduction histidine kinase